MSSGGMLMEIHIASRLGVLAALAALIACAPEEPRCESVPGPVVDGDGAAGDGPVVVSTAVAGERVLLEVGRAGSDRFHKIEFALHGEFMDERQGGVGGQFIEHCFGEGCSMVYARLTDERGLWFEGGASGSDDDEATGGALLDSPFSLGDKSGERCATADADVDLHEVLVTLDGGSAVASAEGVRGELRGMPVLAVGLQAYQGSFFASGNVDDGDSAGFHTEAWIRGYAFRVR